MLASDHARRRVSILPRSPGLSGLAIAEQRERLADPTLRRRILAEKPSAQDVSRLAQFRQLITTRWDKFSVMGDPPDYEPPGEPSCAAIPARPGRPPAEAASVYLTEAETRTRFFPVVNYAAGDHDPLHEMVTDSGT